jgi:hypothetical protein
MNTGGARAWRSGADEPRVLVFTAPALSVELELLPGYVFGQVLPPCLARIRAETADGATIDVETDEAGFFNLSAVPRGRFRLRCETPAGRLVTDWVCP